MPAIWWAKLNYKKQLQKMQQKYNYTNKVVCKLLV